MIVVRKPNCTLMVQTKRVFSRTASAEFSFVFVETPTNFNYNSLKAECCSGEDVLAVFSAGFLKTTKVMGLGGL